MIAQWENIIQLKLNKMIYTLKFLQFYKEFFEEEGYKWSLQEVKEKLIEDNIKEYKLN